MHGAQYREFVPDVTSTDAGDATGAANQPTDETAASSTGSVAGADEAVLSPPAAETEQRQHDPWTVTGVVIAAVLIAACVAAALAAIVPSRTDIPGLPSPGTITDLLLPAVKAIFDLSAALTVGWLLAAAWLVPAAAIGPARRRRVPGDQGSVAGRDRLGGRPGSR